MAVVHVSYELEMQAFEAQLRRQTNLTEKEIRKRVKAHGRMQRAVQKDAKATARVQERAAKQASMAWKGAMVGVVAGVGLAARAVGKLMSGLSATVDAANKLAAGTGLSVETIGALEFALGKVGGTVKEYETGLRSMVQRMDMGSRAFRELGVEVRDADGNLRSADEVLDETIAALAGIDDATHRAALGAELFGSRGQALANILPEVNAEMEKGRELAANWYGPAAQQASEDYDLSMRAAKTVTRDLGDQLAIGLMPILKALAKGVVLVSVAFDEYSTRMAEALFAVNLLMTEGFTAANEYAGQVLEARDGLGFFAATAKRTGETIDELFRVSKTDVSGTPLDPSHLGDLGRAAGEAAEDVDDLAGSYWDLFAAAQKAAGALTVTDEEIADADDDLNKSLDANRDWLAGQDRKRAEQRAADDQDIKDTLEQQERNWQAIKVDIADQSIQAAIQVAERLGLDAFRAEQASAVASIAINAIRAAMAWSAQVPPPAVPAAIAAAAALGVVQAGLVLAAPPPAFHVGGLIGTSGTAYDERIKTLAGEPMVGVLPRQGFEDRLRGQSGSPTFHLQMRLGHRAFDAQVAESVEMTSSPLRKAIRGTKRGPVGRRRRTRSR